MKEQTGLSESIQFLKAHTLDLPFEMGLAKTTMGVKWYECPTPPMQCVQKATSLWQDWSTLPLLIQLINI